MPGVLPHLFAGTVLYLFGKFIFKDYFIKKPDDLFFLAVVCLLTSILPDVSLGIYYFTHILSFETLKEYHNLVHFIFSPIAFIILFIPIFWKGLSKRPIWIMGLLAIGIHVVMDLLFQEYNILI
jgi:Na+/melibiose symporter-like transporter